MQAPENQIESTQRLCARIAAHNGIIPFANEAKSSRAQSPACLAAAAHCRCIPASYFRQNCRAMTSTRIPLTPNQIRGFWAAWGGWVLDGMDSFIYALVLVPAMRDLLPRSGIAATTANIGYYGGVLFALFMIGWGTGLIWGPIADRFGRVRTMMLSIA